MPFACATSGHLECSMHNSMLSGFRCRTALRVLPLTAAYPDYECVEDQLYQFKCRERRRQRPSMHRMLHVNENAAIELDNAEANFSNSNAAGGGGRGGGAAHDRRVRGCRHSARSNPRHCRCGLKFSSMHLPTRVTLQQDMVSKRLVSAAADARIAR